jgi:hypothetical protein
MTESDFIDAIDCNFPYDNFDRASELISQAGGISQNATYMVLHEILRAPPPVTLQTKELLFNMWVTDYEEDPLFALVRRCVPAYLKNELVPEHIVEQLILKMSPNKNQLCALGLIYFSCEDASGQAQAAYQTVLSLWNLN